DEIRKVILRTPRVNLVEPRTLEDQISGAIAPRSFQAALLATFATLALVLALIGTYGVLSYAVSERTHEIGVRVALGAGRRDVLKTVLTRGAALALAGIALGLIGSFGLTRFMATMLYAVKPTDAWTFSSVCLTLLVVAMLAAYLPARRAVRV